MDLSEPLSDDELDELEDFLSSEAAGEEAMDLSMLDGFVTALAVGPVAIPAERWLPVVFDEEPAWASEAQRERITALILRHANATQLYLHDEPDAFEPLLYEREQEGRTVQIIDEWCTGFVQGMVLDEPAWQPLLEAEEGDDLLYAILLFGTEAGWDELRSHPELEARQEEFAASLGDDVIGIHDWWEPVRKSASTVRRDEPKVGRNDLCPCGSGRKFKKCCGAPDRLH